MFKESKATAVACYFLGSAPGKKLNDLILMKLMYIAERRCLEKYSATMTGSSFYSLPKGPILSEVLSLMNGKRQSTVWADHVKFHKYPREGVSENTVKLVAPMPAENYLSRAEIEILAEVWSTHKNDRKWDLVELTHNFPEWDKEAYDRDTSIPLKLEAIFSKGFHDSPELAREKAADLAYYDSL